MGVTDDSKESFGFQYIEKELNVIESYLEDKEGVKGPASPRSRRRRYVPPAHVRDSAHRRRQGARQARRVESLKFLIEMSEQEEIDPSDMEYVELVEPGLSAFAELFAETEKMKIWNDFITCSEDEQQDILLGLAVEEPTSGEEPGDVQRQDSWEIIEDDRRIVHPAYTAEECYKRIDQNLRTFLRKKQLPWGALEHLEGELMSFFHEWPVSVYVCHLESSFERMLLHALCQYLDLHSHSYNDQKGTRQTQVENNHGFFSPPETSLSQFLKL